MVDAGFLQISKARNYQVTSHGRDVFRLCGPRDAKAFGHQPRHSSRIAVLAGLVLLVAAVTALGLHPIWA